MADRPPRSARLARRGSVRIWRRHGWSRSLASLCLGVAAAAHARPLELAQFDHMAWTSRDGAPANIVCMVQGKDGLLWLGTDAGLYSFDGRTFTPFLPAADERALPSASVSALAAASDGSLWIGFFLGGIAQVHDGHVVHVYAERDGLPAGTVSQIVAGADGRLRAVARNRLFVLRGTAWQEDPAASAPQREGVNQLFVDRAGTTWANTAQSLWRLPAGATAFERSATAGSFSAHFAQAQDGTLWRLAIRLGSQPNELSAIGGTGPASTAHAVSGDRVVAGEFQDLLPGADGWMWVASDHGLVRFDPLAAVPPPAGMSTRFGRLDGLSGETALALAADALGDVWVSTSQGLDRFQAPRLTRFVELPPSYVPSIARCPSGTLWFGSQTYGLMSLRDRVAGRSRKTMVRPRSLHCGRDDSLWVTADEGLWRLHDGAAALLPLPAGLSPVSVRLVVDDAHGLWVSMARSGLWRHDGDGWRRVGFAGLGDLPPIAMSVDADDTLWAGFADGRLARLDATTQRVFPPTGATPLGAVQVVSRSQRYGLVAGGANGIAVLDGDHLRTLAAVDRTAVRGVSGLLETPAGDLWLNGLRGVVRIPAAEIAAALASPAHAMRSELVADSDLNGPAPQMLSVPSAFADRHGRFWFSTANAIVSIDPANLLAETSAPVPGVTTMLVDGLPAPASRELPPGYHSIHFRYAANYLRAPQDVVYRYRLEGVDTAWQDADHRTETTYTGLKPGRYVFHVTASNGHDVWSPPDDAPAFTVRPAIWQATSFRVLAAALAVLAGWALFALRMRQAARAIGRREEARANERVRIARDLHDTLLQGVQGLMLRFHVAMAGLPVGSDERRQLENAMARADVLMAEGRDRVTQLRSVGVGVGDEELATALRTIGRELDEHGATRFDVRTIGRPRLLQESAREELFQIAREAITNAFRHASATHIEVTLTWGWTRLRLQVRDDGRGFDADGPRLQGHFGQTGMTERAAVIGARLRVGSEPGHGSTVTVVAPARSTYARHRFGAASSRPPPAADAP